VNTTYDSERNVVYVRSEKCETCIFTRNRPVTVGRVRGMVRAADADGSCIPCHKHLYVGEAIQPVCRGYFDRKSSVTLRLAVAVGIVEFTDD
jgi:hypothetical protein